jgi:hypothetical protein
LKSWLSINFDLDNKNLESDIQLEMLGYTQNAKKHFGTFNIIVGRF